MTTQTTNMTTLTAQMDTTNRPDEWKIEQGMAGHKLPILDQSGLDTVHIYPPKPTQLYKDEEAIEAVGDRNELFKREKEGWKGYDHPLSLLSKIYYYYVGMNY